MLTPTQAEQLHQQAVKAVEEFNAVASATKEKLNKIEQRLRELSAPYPQIYQTTYQTAVALKHTEARGGAIAAAAARAYAQAFAKWVAVRYGGKKSFLRKKVKKPFLPTNIMRIAASFASRKSFEYLPIGLRSAASKATPQPQRVWRPSLDFSTVAFTPKGEY